MEACWTVRGGQHKRALEVHPEEEEEAATAVVSKRINLGHNNNSSRVVVEHIEAPTTVRGGGGRRHKKRAFWELHLHEEEEDSDDRYPKEIKEPTFVAGADGAYSNLEMPKRINLGYDVGESSARYRALDAADERDAALILRLTSAVARLHDVGHQGQGRQGYG